ncbi:MAG: type II secretion system F family protein [Brotaphodocola sp.]
MATYRYQAVDQKGRMVRGTMMAMDECALFHKLKAEEICLIDAKPLHHQKSYRRWKANVLARFCKEIGVLITSGVPLAKAVELVSKNEQVSLWERNIYENLLKSLRQGYLLSDTMESLGEVFPVMLIQLMRAAEAAGNIGESMLKMADHYAKEYRMKEKWKTISAYPKIMTGVLAMAVMVLFGYVLPQMESLFQVLDEMPTATRMVYAVIEFFQKHGRICLVGIGVGCMTMLVLMHMEVVRFWTGKIQLHIPVTGKLWRVHYTAQTAEVLNALYASGLSMTNALQMTKDTIGNPYLKAEFEGVIAKVRRGERISDALRTADGFSGKLADAVQIGEEAGSLGQMLLTAANDLRYEAEYTEERMLTYLEPAMILVMALIVGFIMAAVLLPVYQSYTALEMMSYN